MSVGCVVGANPFPYALLSIGKSVKGLGYSVCSWIHSKP